MSETQRGREGEREQRRSGNKLNLRRLALAGASITAILVPGGAILEAASDPGVGEATPPAGLVEKLTTGEDANELCHTVTENIQKPGATVSMREGVGSFERNGQTITVTNPVELVGSVEDQTPPIECGFGKSGTSLLLPDSQLGKITSTDAWKETGSDIQSAPIRQVTIDSANFSGPVPEVTGTYVDENNGTINVQLGMISAS